MKFFWRSGLVFHKGFHLILIEVDIIPRISPATLAITMADNANNPPAAPEAPSQEAPVKRKIEEATLPEAKKQKTGIEERERDEN